MVVLVAVVVLVIVVGAMGVVGFWVVSAKRSSDKDTCQFLITVMPQLLRN